MTPHVGLFGQVIGVWEWSEILWVVLIALAVQFLLRKTRFGTRVVATGGNLLGAAEAGVPVRRVKIMCFVLCSFLSGLVGIVDAVKYGTLDPGNPGVNFILYAVGACVIGGTALTGGRGTVIGAFIGAILIGVLEAGSEHHRCQHERLLRLHRRHHDHRHDPERLARPPGRAHTVGLAEGTRR